MPLSAQQQRNCQYCFKDKWLNVYEDDIYAKLIAFLCQVTCVLWVRGFEKGQRPDSPDITAQDQQYGTVCITSYKLNGDCANELICGENNEGCRVYTRTMDVSVQLDVYRESGEANKQQNATGTGEVYGSASDVLIRLFERIEIERFYLPLQEQGIALENLGRINALVEEDVNCVNEQRANTTFDMKVCRRYGIAEDTLKCIDFSMCELKGEGATKIFDAARCDDENLCEEKDC